MKKAGQTKKYRVGFFIPVENIKEFRHLFGYSQYPMQAACHILDRIGKLFGLQVGLEIPPELLEEAELKDPVSTIAKLRKNGYIHNWSLKESPYPDEPLLYIGSVNLKNHQSPDEKSFSNGSGFSFLSRKKALEAAIGEAVERWSFFNFTPEQGKTIQSSYNELIKKDEHVLDIFSLAGINPKLRKQKEFKFLQYDDETSFRWVRGHSLTSKKKLLIPAQLLSSRASEEAYTKDREPVLRPLVTTGLATHRTAEKALLGGILELIERDAFMITWLNALTPNKLNLEEIADVELQASVKMLRDYYLEPHLLILPTDMPVQVVLSVIIDRSGIGPAISIGASAHFDVTTAASKALTESIASRVFVRNSLVRARNKNQDLSFKERDKIGREERLLYWCDICKIEDISFLLKGTAINPKTIKEESGGVREQTAKLVEAFRKKGYELAYVDVTNEDMKKLGYHTLMVIAPQLQPLHLKEGVPFNWGERLVQVPAQKGFKRVAPTNKEVHPFP